MPGRGTELAGVDACHTESQGECGALQKYRLYLKRMSGLHPGANGRKGGGKGASLPHDANFQACALEPEPQPALKVSELARVAEQAILCPGEGKHTVLC